MRPKTQKTKGLSAGQRSRKFRAMWLCEQEQIILKYLEHAGETGATVREVCRKAWTKDAWKDNERWAYPYLSSLKDKKLVVTTPAGNYRLPPREDDEEEKKKRPSM